MFNLVTIQTVDGEIVRSMLAYDTMDAVYSAMYSTLAYSTASETVTKCICAILNDEAVMLKKEVWSRTVIKVTTEEQTEEEQTEEE